MNALIKSLGGIILLIGVGILAVPAFMDLRLRSNTVLLIGLATIIAGFLIHIFLNKKID